MNIATVVANYYYDKSCNRYQTQLHNAIVSWLYQTGHIGLTSWYHTKDWYWYQTVIWNVDVDYMDHTELY